MTPMPVSNILRTNSAPSINSMRTAPPFEDARLASVVNSDKLTKTP